MELAVVLLWVVPLVLIAALGLQPATGGDAERWATSFGVFPLGAHLEPVRRVLTHGRRWRFGGAFVAWLAFSVVRANGEPAIPWVNALVVITAGYLVGAVLAELTSVRSVEANAALLVPRTPSAYIPRLALAGLVVLPAIGAVLVGIFVRYRPDPRFGLSTPATLAASVVVSAALGVGVWLAVRWIVGRRQPAGSADLLALDDAFRASSSFVLVGAGLALQLSLLAFGFGQAQGALSQAQVWHRLQALLTLLGFACLPLALACWMLLRHPSHWRSRRIGSAAAG